MQRALFLFLAVGAAATGNAAVVRSVQHGLTALPANAASPGTQAVNVPISAVDLTRAFVLFSLRIAPSNSPDVGGVRGALTATNTLTFSRGSNAAAAMASWYVVEFESGVRVHHSVPDSKAGSTPFTFSPAVTLGQSFTTVSGEVPFGDIAFSEDDYYRALLLSPTSIEVTQGGGFAKVVSWQVVDYQGATVQRGTGALASGIATASHGITAIDPGSAFGWASWRVGGTGAASQGGARNLLRAFLPSTNSVQVERAVTGTVPIEYVYEVVSFQDGTRVATGNATFSDGVGTRTLTLGSAFDLNRTVTFLTGAQRGGTHTYTTSQTNAPGWFTAELTAANSVQLVRGDPSGDATATYVVVEWALRPAGAACTQTGDCQSGHCVDGVCCASACAGGTSDCQACSTAAGAATDGVCGPVAAAQLCRAATSACDAPELCDGAQTACPPDAPRPDGDACAGGACQAGVCVAASEDAGLPPPDAGPDLPPETPEGELQAECGTPLEATLRADGGGVALDGPLPEGASWDGTTLRWTPTAAQAGDHPLSASTDGDGGVLAWTVRVECPPLERVPLGCDVAQAGAWGLWVAALWLVQRARRQRG